MGGNLTTNYFEVTAVICFGIGFTMLFLNKNLIKKVIGCYFKIVCGEVTAHRRTPLC